MSTSKAELEAKAVEVSVTLESFMARLFHLYDTTKALPHPYSAVNEQANRLLHDFPSVANSVNAYVTALTGIDKEAGE